MKNIRYLPWNWGFWHAYQTFLALFMWCTNLLCDSYHLTKVNLHIVPSPIPITAKCKQLLTLLWCYQYISQPLAIVMSQWMNDVSQVVCTDVFLTQIKKESPGYFTLGEAIIKEPQPFANHFNEFFVGVGPCLSKEISNTETKSVSTYLKQNIMTSFTFDCVSESTVMGVIKLKTVLGLTPYCQICLKSWLL